MKKLLLAILALIGCFQSFSQISTGGTPPSFSLGGRDVFPFVQTGVPDFDSIAGDLSRAEKNGTLYPVGRRMEVNLDLGNSGEWKRLPDGQMLWRVGIVAPGARATGLHFSRFNLPMDGHLFVYSADHEQVIGAFTREDEIFDRGWTLEPIHGDSVILEVVAGGSAFPELDIHLAGIAYLYRDYTWFPKNTSDFGDSDPCEVNINCSPEGNNWQDEKRGVCRILVKAGSIYGWCSGSVVNNTALNFLPYVLTADHCATGTSTSDLNQWVFYFNFESASCANPASQPTSNTMTGAMLKARCGTAGETGSDFFLVQLNQLIPASYNVYYNGWNRNTSATAGGVGIHHPAGDIRKISTYSQVPVSGSWGTVSGTHWKLVWVATTNGHGVTEGGSSGSPLFDSNGRIIGQLTGGASYCTSTSAQDYFGKFSYSWQSNGTTNATRLMPWLDPGSTNALTLNGAYNVSVSFTGLAPFYCANAGPVSLAGSPAGGSFSGTGVNGNQFSPVSAGAGTYTITYTTQWGTSSQVVTVNPLPSVNLGPDLSVSQPQSVTLTAPIGNQYYWSTGQTTQSISLVDVGVYLIAVTVTNSSGCQSADQISVTITALAVPVPSPGWSYSNTGVNHTILIPASASMTVAGQPLAAGDYLGVFFDSLGTPACGGYIAWNGSSTALAAWGYDANLGGDNGFNPGESFSWKVWKASTSLTIPVTVTYNLSDFPNAGTFVGNGMSGIQTLTDVVSETQTISLPAGWNLFSTYILTGNANISAVMAGVADAISIAKDMYGNAWWPQFSVNGIGAMTVGRAYQVNLTQNRTLSITGNAVIPQTTPLLLPVGWSFLGYLRKTPAPVVLMMSPVYSALSILKNDAGAIYWPVFGVNSVVNLIPGEGYQVRLTSAATLTYPAN